MPNEFSLRDSLGAGIADRQRSELNALRTDSIKQQNALLPDPWTILLQREDEHHSLQ